MSRRRARLLLPAVILGLLPAFAGYGFWQLERNQPLWRHPGLGPAARPAAIPPGPRRVLAVHYPWYGTPTGPTGRWRHWNHARLAMPHERILGFHDPDRSVDRGRLDLGSTHYPAGGPYDSRDPGLIAAQFGAAQAAGLDGFVVSWWGGESMEGRAFGELLAAARGSGLVLAPYYETGELWRRGAEGVAADLEGLLHRHQREPAWLRMAGLPVVFLYAAHRLRPAAWEYVIRRLQATHHPAFLVAEAPSPAWVRRHPGWVERFDALHVYTPVGTLVRGQDLAALYREWAVVAREAGRLFVPAVAPGFDDRAIRVPGSVVPRAGGATYDATWRAALAVEPPWVLVASWNEWHEGSEIEPSVEHGGAYLESTRRWAERFRAGRR